VLGDTHRLAGDPIPRSHALVLHDGGMIVAVVQEPRGQAVPLIQAVRLLEAPNVPAAGDARRWPAAARDLLADDRGRRVSLVRH